MTRLRHQTPAFTLLELVFVIPVTAIILLVLGKLLLDGLYLQRIAAERANRLAVTKALTERLRADALGAVAYAWSASESAPSLKLRTYADGSCHQVDWVFRQDEVVRRVDGRAAGGFHTERVRFSTQIMQNKHSDILVLELFVQPPTRSRYSSPQSYSKYVLLPRQARPPTNTAKERLP